MNIVWMKVAEFQNDRRDSAMRCPSGHEAGGLAGQQIGIALGTGGAKARDGHSVWQRSHQREPGSRTRSSALFKPQTWSGEQGSTVPAGTGELANPGVAKLISTNATTPGDRRDCLLMMRITLRILEPNTGFNSSA